MLIKICGLTREEDAVEAARLGATHLGFVFAPSPRRVTPERAARILEAVDRAGYRSRVRAVGVFVNEEPATLRSTSLAAGLDLVQLHGEETREYADALGVPWYRALRPGSAAAGAEEAAIWARPGAILLADALVRGEYGGTGVRLDEETAADVRDAVRKAGGKFVLAGGLAPGNIAGAVRGIRPDGVDVSSGLESSPGIKSEEKMRAFFRALTEAEHA